MNIGTSSVRGVILIAMMISTAVSCSKKENRTSVTLSFSQGQNSALSLNYKIQHIILQEDDGLNGSFFREWDCEIQNACSSIISGGKVTLQFETTVGKDRPLQLLVIADVDDGTGKNTMGFFYHGGRFDLNKPLPPFELAEIEKDINMAVVSGRYVPTANHPLSGRYLTGEIATAIKASTLPGFSYPDMPLLKVLDSEIFGGYTNLYVFENIPATYIFRGFDQAGNFHSKTRILNDLHPGENGLTTDSAGLVASGNSRVRYTLNANSGFFYDERDGVPVQRYFIENITGFFGANPNGRYLCAEDDPTGQTFDGSNSSEELCANATCSSHFNWSDIAVAGDVNGPGDTCTDNLGLNMELMDLPEEGEMLDFFGPFVGAGSTTDSVDFDEDTGVLTWNWNTNVHGVRGVPAVEIFVRTLASNFNEDVLRVPKSNGLFCDRLLGQNFRSAAVLDRGTNSFTLSPNDLANENLVMAVCFRRPVAIGGGYYKTAHLEDGDRHSQPKLIEMRLVDSTSGATEAGYDYNSLAWVGDGLIKMDPVDAATESKQWFEIRNTSDNIITVDSAHFHATVGGLSFEWTTSDANPSGKNRCPDLGNATFNLNPGEECVFQIMFDPTVESFTQGATIHQGVSISSYDTVTAEYSDFSFNLVPLVELYVPDSTLASANVALAVELFAPEGEATVKVIRFENNDSINTWDIGSNIPASGANLGGSIRIHHNCGVLATLGGECHLYVHFRNPEGSGFTEASVAGSFPVPNYNSSYSLTINPVRLVDRPVLNEASIYDNYVSFVFPLQFSGGLTNQTETLTITNDSSQAMAIRTPGQVNSVSHSYSMSYSGTPTYGWCFDSLPNVQATGATCEFDLATNYTGSSATLVDWFNFWYGIEGTYRIFDFDVVTDHQ